MRTRSLCFLVVLLASIAMAGPATAAPKYQGKVSYWTDLDWFLFSRQCSALGGESIGGDRMTCILPDGTVIDCDVVNGRTRTCRKTTTSTSYAPYSPFVYSGGDVFVTAR